MVGRAAALRGVQGVQQQRQVAVSQLTAALLVADVDGLQLLEHQREVADHDIGAQRADGRGAREEAVRELMRRATGAVQLLSRVGRGPCKGLLYR